MSNYITPRMLSPEKQKELLDKFPNCSDKELAALYGLKEATVTSFAHKHGVHKSEEYKAITNCGRFKKGSVPVNKGTKMPKEVYDKVKATMYKKGNVPANLNSMGSIRLSKDGYLYIKTKEGKAQRNYELLHRHIWVGHNGPIPEGHNVQFKDGDRKNCNIDNLYLISRAEQLRNENSLHVKYPKEIAELIQIKGAINRQIRQKLKQE